MTRYAVDESRRALVASWSTGSGDVAVSVATLPASAMPDQALRLSEEASRLSAALWRCYTHPASAADGVEVNSEGRQRQETRKALGSVVNAVRQPHLPRNGMMIEEYDPVLENAHRLGRALRAIGDPELADRLAADIEAELGAVERAECGDLSGRGRQAVALTRQDASPVQVAAAERVLHDDPLVGDRLFTEFDPSSAAVAAAQWLWAAAVVTARQSGLDVTAVVREADNIEALPWETPTVVLGHLADGLSPHSVVIGLISDAMMVAGGEIPDLIALVALADQVEARSHGDPELCQQLLARIRPTPLDPSRPALDLLEDLLSGIRACWLVFLDSGRGAALADAAGEDDAHYDDGGDGSAGDDARTEEFVRLVRIAAAEEHDWLP